MRPDTDLDLPHWTIGRGAPPTTMTPVPFGLLGGPRNQPDLLPYDPASRMAGRRRKLDRTSLLDSGSVRPTTLDPDKRLDFHSYPSTSTGGSRCGRPSRSRPSGDVCTSAARSRHARSRHRVRVFPPRGRWSVVSEDLLSRPRRCSADVLLRDQRMYSAMHLVFRHPSNDGSRVRRRPTARAPLRQPGRMQRRIKSRRCRDQRRPLPSAGLGVTRCHRGRRRRGRADHHYQGRLATPPRTCPWTYDLPAEARPPATAARPLSHRRDHRKRRADPPHPTAARERRTVGAARRPPDVRRTECALARRTDADIGLAAAALAFRIVIVEFGHCARAR